MRGRKSRKGRRSSMGKKSGMGMDTGMMYGEEYFSEVGRRGRKSGRR